jgi:ATP-dependent helicase HrpB
MQSLPIDHSIPEVIAALRKSRSVVLVAPPGAGKTTRVPPAVLASGLLAKDHPNVVMLQPRRVAARASAQRIAEENGWELGGEVGYQVRFERRIGPTTRLRVLTEGILTRQLLEDPFLDGIGAVILDEFHERSIHTDLCAALLREVRQTVRDDLILIVMSATLEAEPVARFLGDCPIVRSEGRAFPVEIRHAGWSQDSIADQAADAVRDVLESARSLSRRQRSASNNERPLPSPGTPGEGQGEGLLIPREKAGREQNAPHPNPLPEYREREKNADAAGSNLPALNRGAGADEDDNPGDVLVFLPGVEEIRRTMGRLEPLARERDLLLLPLHGSLPPEEQLLALRPAAKRKVILATNVAETSLTIDGVRTVIDSGYARIAGYDPQRGLDRLDLRRISKASAAQRTGRAGRTGPGRCIRLWSAAEERAMADFQDPEVRRVDLCGTVLLLHAWGKPDPRTFGWYEPPPEASLAAAERLLAMLGALSAETNGQITPLGNRLMAFPAHPRLARLLLAAADARRLEEGAALAALLSEKDIAWADRGAPGGVAGRSAKTQGPSDLLIRLEMLARAESAGFAAYLRDEGIDPAAARQVAKSRDDLLRIARRLSDGGRPRRGEPGEDTLLLKFALLAYPDRVCRRRASDPAAGVMVGGQGVRLAAESVVKQPEFFLALDARQDERSVKREALVRVASGIEAEWLEELFPQEIRRERSAVFDESRGRVVGRGQTWYRDLLLHEDDDAAVDPRKAAEVLGAAVRPMAADWFARDKAAGNFLARVALLRQYMPEHPWPAFDAAELGEVLAEACAGKRGLDELRRVPLAAALASRLGYPLDRLLNQHAPEALVVPSGSRIGLDYSAGSAPVLAVRLQEVFGWTDTPRVANGRVPVLLHLLGPNYRPVQITNDLRSFWSTTYFQVRKDLRIRYPKHAWPEDPLSAKAEAKGRQRK